MPDLATAAPAARAAPAPPPPSVRRHTLFGRFDRDTRLMLLAEGWRQRVETDAPFELLQAAKSGPYDNPVVTVALRRDGSVEAVTINRSSGSAAIDAAVRKVIAALAPFPPFPPDLALDYDVIEIRRVWSFDVALRLNFGGR